MTKANRRRIGWSIAGIAGAALVIAAFFVVPTHGVQTEGGDIPTARVAQGDVPVVVHTTGELRPVRSVGLVAPAIGGPLQILTITGTGTPVKAGDVVVEFDLSEQEEKLAQAKSELEQAEQEITKLRADIVVQRAQEQVTLLTARFDVRRADLDVQANAQASELVGVIDAKKKVLILEEAKGRLEQLQTDLKSRDTTDRASLAVLLEKRNKARLAMETAQRNIDQMRIRAPYDGVVAVKDNDTNGAAWTGMVVPEYRAGDTVWPGRPVAEVLHESGLELVAKVTEYDRAHLNAGQKAEVAIHAVQGTSLPATIKNVAGASRRSDFFGWDSTRMFDVSLQVSGGTADLRPGLTTQVRVTGDPIKNVLYLPRQALFEQDGKPVVFVRRGRSFEPRAVKVADRTEAQIVIADLPVGTEVALRNPLAESKKNGSSGGPVQPGAGS
jgi:multidrug efflux pump subunit AcrA (membrane-fusion protein)